MKRTFDLLVSITGLLLLSPLFLLIALLIKLDDRDKIFFRQQRVGRHGKLFIIYKFRTMKVRNGTIEGTFEPGDLSAVTSTGRFLRKSKLDELPQLLNVLIGDMSIVGPRPEIRKWVDAYPEKWKEILTVRPGITDNASILFRKEEYLLAESANPEQTYKDLILPEKMELYEQYVVSHSFVGDIKLIIKTFRNLFR